LGVLHPITATPTEILTLPHYKKNEIDAKAWYIKFDKGSADSQWESIIKIDEGGLSSKTYMFSDNTFEGVVHKTWTKCKE